MASQSDSNLFSMRIVSIDYYMAPPIPEVDPCYSTFHGRNVEEVPVIRIYGSTLAGQKTCLHVHRALPYLYVPCFDVSLQSPQDGHAYSQFIARSVEEALKNKTSAGLKRQHVHGCSLVRARKFYGYHSAEDLFVKIYLYYPREVTRAATLLLEGAVLNRNFQPYESHIPYLLQFLVDYNLYGMGLLHLTKVKFRNPLPDHFIPREARNAGHSRWDIENNSCDFANSEAVSHGETSQDPAIWLSTKVPSGWIWPLPSVDSQDLCMKRQSTCELEGDATVDEIVNQQFKMYTSLSQARPEVKMVQSLIPIWEEEYERTGLHEIIKSPDSSKPLPDMVLRTFCQGLEIEKELVELCTEALNMSRSQTTPVEGEETFVKSVRSVSDVGTSLSSRELVRHTDSDGEPSKVLTEEDNDGCRFSQGSFIEDSGTPKLMPAFRSIHEQNLSYEETGASDPKVVDREALGLLSWLASSQAVDNLCTDEDLVNEAVLSPLLPTTTIEEILDKARLDYAIESQQECQDILDSVEAVSDYLDNRLSEHVIPQVDGASDDQFKYPPQTGKPSKSEMNKPSKGSLPISTKRKVQEDSVHSCHNSPIEMDNGSDSSAFTKAKVDKSHVGLAINENVDFSHLCKGNSLIGCSVRDLMRRKRAHQVEPSESGSHSIKKLVLGKEECAATCSTGLGSVGSDANSNDCSPNYGKLPFSSFATSNDRESIGATGGSENSAFSESEVQEYFISGHEESKSMTCTGPCECCNRREEFATSSSKPAPSYIQRCKPDLLSSGRLLKFDKDENQLAGEVSEVRDLEITVETNGDYNSKKLDQDIKICSSSAVRTLWDGDDTRFIEMTLTRKPPAIDWRQRTSKATLSVPACDNDLIMKLETFEWTSKISSEGREVDDIPLFFDSNCLEGNQCSHNSAIERGNANVHQETALGVATHYQNDGSLLYLLTPALSPPSNDLVSQWVLQQTVQRSADSSPGAHEDNLQPVLMEPSSPKYDEVLLENHKICSTSSIDMDSHVRDVSLPSCRASPYVEPPGCQSCKEKNRSLEMEVNQCHTKRVGTEPKIEKIHVKEKEGTQSWQELSQMSGPDSNSKLTPFSQTGFRDPAIVGARQQLTLMSIEVVAESRGDLQPDPRYDAVNVIALAIQEDSIPISDICVLVRAIDGEQSHRNVDGLCGCKVVTVSEEKHLFDHFLKIISSFDPDVLMGWEVQGGSLGFLAERAAHLGIRLLKEIARAPIVETKHPASDSANFETGMMDSPLPEALLADSVVLDEAIIGDEWGRIHGSGLHVGGRIVLNIWRIIRWELNLHMYTIEAVAEAVLRKKVPSIPSRTLSVWFSSGHRRARFRCIEYVVDRAKLSFEIINQLDLVNRTAELARVYGIDFFSVLSRGSQYRVESMYLRLAHTQNYLSISPGPQQVSSQPAMECLPLVMEPESGFYVDPVVVLDFQSLYPSMIIAYNLCFSTCLGNVLPSKSNRLGVSSYKAEPQHLMHLKDQILLTPNGVMYVPPQVRKGVLPRLLEEILSTRIMVKQAMKKLSPQQRVLRRIFNARQLALKLIANVTYGYAAAGFSGRMPCAELADSIVQCGRRTLETAISFVNSHDKWNAKVIYGDTDSMFVLLKGRRVEEAFRIGQEIASSITSMNPNPVTLKMDKVYYPCVLLTKKRYVGYSYESVDQVKPIFDAKGIETVRRDACPIVAKTLEQSLKILFETRNISIVKEYLQHRWTKILSGKVSFQDFVFSKEVHLGRYRASSLPPAALVASKAMRADPRAEPRYGERIAYIVIHGEPGARLADMVVDPLELLDINSSYRLNDLYYINKQIIPALQRVFGLFDADLNQWFSEMPRPVRPTFAKRHFTRSHLGSRCDSDDNRQRTSRKLQGNRTRIDYYYLSKHCIICDELAQDSTYLCERCSKSGPVVVSALVGKTSKLEREIHHLAAICRHCGGGDWIVESGVKCQSLACSVFYERRKVQKELQAISSVATEAGFYPRCMVEWF